MVIATTPGRSPGIMRKLAAGTTRRSWGIRTGGDHEKGQERLEDTLRPAARPEVKR
jgi:hypothetical protein